MERPHSPKITSSPAACDTLSCLLRELDAQPTDFDCIVTGDLGRVGADLLLTLLREDGIDTDKNRCAENRKNSRSEETAERLAKAVEYARPLVVVPLFRTTASWR